MIFKNCKINFKKVLKILWWERVSVCVDHTKIHPILSSMKQKICLLCLKSKVKVLAPPPLAWSVCCYSHMTTHCIQGLNLPPHTALKQLIEPLLYGKVPCANVAIVCTASRKNIFIRAESCLSCSTLLIYELWLLNLIPNTRHYPPAASTI